MKERIKELNVFQKVLVGFIIFFLLIMITDFYLKISTDKELLLQMYTAFPIFILCYSIAGLFGFILVVYKQNVYTRILASFFAIMNLVGIVFFLAWTSTGIGVKETRGQDTYYTVRESFLHSTCYNEYRQLNYLVVVSEGGICTE